MKFSLGTSLPFLGKLKSLLTPTASDQLGKVTMAQVFWPAFGFLLFAALAGYAFYDLRVHGPEFDKLQNNNDLRADILPPPLYAVDAFAAVNEAYVAEVSGDVVKRNKKLNEVARYEQTFKERERYWRL
jgi:twitching motility protein PilJ